MEIGLKIRGNPLPPSISPSLARNPICSTILAVTPLDEAVWGYPPPANPQQTNHFPPRTPYRGEGGYPSICRSLPIWATLLPVPVRPSPAYSSPARRILPPALLFLASIALAAPAFAQAAPPADLPDAPGAAAAQAKPEPVPTGPTILIDTSMGRLTCKTFDQQAPIAVANFIGLAEGTKDWTTASGTVKHHGQRFYDGLAFHRVIPGFMIQGGDPAGDGTGDPGYYFDNEVDPALDFSVAGRLAMANSGPNTNGSQFFITEDAMPELNGKYTIFGQCDAHTVLMVASIARVERNHDDKPITPVLINRVTIARAGQPMPPEPVAPPPPPPAPAAPAPPTP